MAQTRLDYMIEVMPWARAMMMTEREKNTFIFSMRRIPAREDRFLWLGALCSAEHSVFSMAGRQDIQVESLDDIKQYTIGTTIEDSRETVLIEQGVPVEKLTRISGDDSYLRNYMKLKFGRIDVWPMDDAVAFHIVKSYGDNPHQVLRSLIQVNVTTTILRPTCTPMRLSSKRYLRLYMHSRKPTHIFRF
jgi:polar amino acid transport system substrate-binding protein